MEGRKRAQTVVVSEIARKQGRSSTRSRPCRKAGVLKENRPRESSLLSDLVLFPPVCIGQHVAHRSLCGWGSAEGDHFPLVLAGERTAGEIVKEEVYRVLAANSIAEPRNEKTFIVFSCRENPAPDRASTPPCQ